MKTPPHPGVERASQVCRSLTSANLLPALIGWALLFLSAGTPVARAATLPSGFTETVVASDFPNATTMEFAPDGRIFVSQQAGALRVVKGGVLLPTPFMTLDVENTGERGLLGIAFDPGFNTNHYLYVYYTSKTPTLHNRVSRFTANGDVVVPGSEVVILDLNDLSAASNHNGGAMHFGPDGKLYIGVGENATPSNAQTLNNLLGKMLRINPDGTIPTDNPFYTTASGVNRAIWALGLRNPFTFAFHPTSGRMLINDVGQNAIEEIDEGIAGANYGWPTCEANCVPSNPAFTDPIFSYPHATGTAGGLCIVGGAFYSTTNLNFPPQYAGRYFYADYVNGWMKTIDPANGNASADFATGLALPVDVRLGPNGGIYYLARGNGGSVNVINYTGALAPQITTQPADQTVYIGSAVSFTNTAIGTAPITYQWQRNGVKISGATSNIYALATTTLADDNAVFSCVIVNPGGTNTTRGATLHVSTNAFPVGTISLPLSTQLYSAGDTISYAAVATDVEDGSLPASAFSWTMVFHHDTHTHPFLGPINGVKSGTFTIPTLGETSANVWYRVYLTVTDSAGQTHTSYVDIRPRTALVTLDSKPSGLQVTLDGQPFTTPTTFLGVAGMSRTIGVTSPQATPTNYNQFVSWSDGGATNHVISTPVSDTTLVANFASTPLVTSTWSNPAFITINNVGAATPYPSSIAVTGLASPVTKVTVALNGYYHTFPDDVDALLVSPGGQGILLMSDVGDSGDATGLNIVLDEGASAYLPDASQVTSGTFKPTNFDTSSDTFTSPAPAGPYPSSFASLLGKSAVGVWSLYLSDDAAVDQGSLSNGWSITFTTPNTPPTLGSIANVTLPSGSASGPIPFTVADAETPAGNLVVSAVSSNPALVTSGGFVFGGSGTNRTVGFTPVSGQTGTATITVSVSDGFATVSNAFVVTVGAGNTPPTLSLLSDLTFPEDASSGPVAFSVGDLETAAGGLSLTAVSSNTALIPNANVVFGGSGASRTLTLTPVANQFGTSTITVTVSDGSLTATRSFLATVTSVNDLPSVSAIAPQTVTKNGSSAAIPFAVGDVETSAASLVVTAISSNQTLLPDANIVLGGAGSSRTVTVTPAFGQTGAATVTVKVADTDGGIATTSFVVTVSTASTFANTAAITVPAQGAATPFPSPITVSGLGGTISRLTVSLTGVNHTYPDDLDILLVGPAGQKVLLMSDTGGGLDLVNLNLTFDDSASASLSDSGQNTSGTYKPTNFDTSSDTFPSPAPAAPYGAALSDFVGSVPNGNWSLYVVDDASSDQGSITGGWSLSIETVGGNTAPTLSHIANLSINQDSVTAPQAFTVGDAETVATALTVAGTSSDTVLVPNANIVFGGSTSNRTVTVTPAAGKSGVATITLTVSDGSATASDSFVLTVNAVNTPPTISDVLDGSVAEDAVLGPIPFTVSDAQTAAGSLVVTATSSNQALVPDANLVLGGSGGNRTVTATPLANQFGSTIITLTVSDGSLTASDTFALTVTPVNDVPVISSFANVTLAEDTASGALAFTIGDVETAPTALVVTAASSNPTLLPDANLLLGGSGASRTLSFTPALNQNGTATVTVTVSDGSSTASASFLVTVTPVNDLPTVSSISNVTVPRSGSSAPLTFTVGDVETSAASLTVAASSSNPSVVPDTGLALGGSGANRSIVVTPAVGQTGTATVTVTVSDADGGTASTSFVVTVTGTTVFGSSSPIAIPSQGAASPYPATLTVSGLSGTIAKLTVTLTNLSHTYPDDIDILLVGPAGQKILLLSDAGGGPDVTNLVLNFDDAASASLPDASILTSGTFKPTNYESTTDTFPSPAPAGPYGSLLSDFIGSVPNGVWSLFVVDDASSDQGSISGGWSLAITTTGGNAAPTISDVPDLTINLGASTSALPVTIGDAETAAGSLLLSAVSSNTALVPNAAIVFGGSGSSRTVTVTPLAGQSGSTVITLTVSDGAATAADTFVLTVNAPPSISDIVDQTINQGTSSAPIPFTVADAETAGGSLTVTAASSNQTLLPNAGIVIGGSAGNRTVTVTPTPSLSGTAVVTVTVSDGLATAQDSFVLTVVAANTPPTITDLPDVGINEDGSTGAIPFVVGDAETPASALTVSGSSSNPTLIPKANIVFGGSGANRSVTLTPTANQSGSSVITLSVTDGTNTVSDTFVLTVVAVNDPPTISSSPNQSVLRNASTGTLTFTVGDVETAAANLVVAGSSSNTTLVPNANIVIGGSGTTRTLVVTPAPGQTGTATITLTVTDTDGGSTSTSFQLTVANVVTFSNTNAIAVPSVGAANPSPSTIAVSGLSGNVVKLTVTLTGLSHTYPDDLDILLVGPAGQKVLLLSDVGGNAVMSGLNLTFDDAAAASLPDAGVILSGTFKPTNYDTNTDIFASPAPAGPYGNALSDFVGTNPNGTWSLYVVDDATSDQGSISGGWSLSLSAFTPQPPVTNSNNTVLTVPDSGVVSTYPSTITVSGMSGVITKVTASLNGVSHTYPDDLDVLLVGPAGQKIILMSDAGASGDLVGANLVFDDAATASLPDATQIVSGTYKPTNFDTLEAFPVPAPAGPYGSALTDFVGTNPNGVWSLYVVDDSSGDSGSIAGWSLVITTTLAAPPPDGPGVILSEANSLVFSSIQNLADGSVAVILTGQLGAEYLIEASEDLQTWVEVARGTFVEPSVQFTDPASPARAQRFYRAHIIP